MKRTGWFSSVVLGLLFLSLAVCVDVGAQPPKRDTIRIGVVSDITGYGEFFGAQQNNSWEMAIKEINDAGGVTVMGKKMKMEAIFGDSKSNAADAAAIAEKLITVDKVDMVYTPVLSATALAILPLLNTYKMVGVNNGAGTPKLTDGTCWWSIRPSCSNAALILAPAVWSAKNVKPKRVAIMALNNEFGRTGVPFIKKVYDDLGIQIVAEEYTKVDETDYTTALTGVKAKSPDMIGTIYYSPQLGLMLKQAYLMGYRPPLNFVNHATGPTEKICLNISGWEAAEGAYGLEGLWVRKEFPRSLTFEEDWLKLTKGKAGGAAIAVTYCYDAVYMIADAFSRVTSIGQDVKSQTELRNALVKTKYYGLGGQHHFYFPDLGQGCCYQYISAVGKGGEKVFKGVVSPEEIIKYMQEVVGVPAVPRPK